MKRSMLSTIDNPHSPFDNFDAWYAYDTMSGYHTSSYLSRIVTVSHDLSEADYNIAIEEAIDEIVKDNILGIYIKVEKDF